MIWLIILILCMSLDSFVLMMEKGATCKQLTKKKACLHSLIFATTNVVMLNFGYLLSNYFFSDELISLNRLIACITLVAIGICFIIRTFRKPKFIEKYDDSFCYKNSLKKAFISGIDTLLIGLIVYYLHIPLFTQILLVFIISFLSIYIALFLGFYQGASHQKAICFSCAFVYFIIAFIQVSLIL